MEKIAAWLPISQQMIDEGEEVAKAEGWDTLAADIEREVARFWDTP